MSNKRKVKKTAEAIDGRRLERANRRFWIDVRAKARMITEGNDKAADVCDELVLHGDAIDPVNFNYNLFLQSMKEFGVIGERIVRLYDLCNHNIGLFMAIIYVCELRTIDVPDPCHCIRNPERIHVTMQDITDEARSRVRGFDSKARRVS